MLLADFVQQVKDGRLFTFQDTLAVIAEHYDYQPTAFSNGVNQPVISQAGQNEGSCKLFAFASLHDLTVEQTLNLFGDYYRVDVLGNPEGSDHQNIRRFMQEGWTGIAFQGQALTAR